MRTTRKCSSKRLKSQSRGFALGREHFARISAVEGIALTEQMLREFEEYDQRGLSAEERRRAIISGYAKSWRDPTQHARR
jgi:hypothetical protein